MVMVILILTLILTVSTISVLYSGIIPVYCGQIGECGQRGDGQMALVIVTFPVVVVLGGVVGGGNVYHVAYF
jgi:hypothetical protein